MFKETKRLRKFIAGGEFGTVSKAIDRVSGHAFATKVIHLDKHQNIDAARALVHREVKIMRNLHHISILFPCLFWI